MMPQSYDFHGVSVEDAIARIEQVISALRLRGESDTVEFITGHGIIKFEARDLLQKRYGFEIFSPLTSPAIVVTID